MHPDYVHYKKEDLKKEKKKDFFFYNFNDWRLNRRYKNIFILVKINVYRSWEGVEISCYVYIYIFEKIL